MKSFNPSVTSCLGDVITNIVFGDRPRNMILGVREDVLLTSSLLNLSFMTLITLGSNLGSMTEAAGVR